MDVVERTIKLLETETGEVPFAKWLQTIRDTETRARILARLKRVQMGNFGDWHPVGEEVSELRLDFGPGYRIYFGVSQTVIVVLLGGGDKSTQTSDIQRAQSLWKENQDETERFERGFPN